MSTPPDSGAATVINTLIAGAAQGVVLLNDGTVNLRHSTVADSSGWGIQNATNAVVAHTILWGNGDGVTTDDMDAPSCAGIVWSIACDCESVMGNQNLCQDPVFVGAGDFHLQALSPALEHGLSPEVFTGDPCKDLDGGPRLRDWDGDGEVVMDAGAYENVNTALTPGEVHSLRWLDKNTLRWDVVAAVERYNVYKDLLDTLAHGSFATCAAGLDIDPTDSELLDTAIPPAGAGWYYLITSVDTDQTPIAEGTLGMATCAERSNVGPGVCP